MSRYDDDTMGVGAWAAIVGIIVAVIALLTFGIMFIMGWKSVPPDKVMLHYTGGPIQGQHFKEVVQPGTHTKFYGLLDNYYYLPSTQRTYTFSRDANVGDKAGVDFISAPSSDNVLFTFEATVYFKLNPNSAVLEQFMNNVCFKYDCTNLDKDGGWDKMLGDYFRPAVEQAVRLEAPKYDRSQLYRDPQTLLDIQNTVGAVLKDRIQAAVGGEYFCGPDSSDNNCTNFGFVLKNPTPPQNVQDEYNNTAAAQQSVVTAQNQADAKAAAAKGDADAQNVRASAQPLTPEQLAYIEAQAEQACATNQNCTLVITQSGGGVNINTGK